MCAAFRKAATTSTNKGSAGKLGPLLQGLCADEKKAGESPDAVLRQGGPQHPAVRAVFGDFR